ncbi:hypothetical protein Ddye_014121 [Dipteronia dyeriana]|uniref:KIB1-4 beta-propeller domain-containing protein n=1 Tax=Dipteronia dyeriana TaxID=168575 RepID=A0AAE0CK80_9ROSI|nr:hypothetical protein Ddye_014121 [Dipteronia dyeriana]
MRHSDAEFVCITLETKEGDEVVTKAADWSALDDLVLEEISQRLTLYQDFAAFRMVCPAWLSAAPKENFKFKCRMPWLVLPPKQGTNLREFFIFPQLEQVQGITQQHLAIPKSDIFPQVEEQGIMDRQSTCYSSKGWLIDIVTVRPLTSLSLLHPFSGAQIKLPQWPKNLNLYNIQKIVLSSNPSFTSSYTVMILHGGPRRYLTYSKPGDEAWTTISTGEHDYRDVTYFEGKFYTVSRHCRIMACDVTGDNPTMAQVTNLPESLLQEDLWDEVYIVGSSGRRLLVVTQVERHWQRGVRTRFRNRATTYGIYEFQVFEVDLSTNNWAKTNDLGNKTLFLGSSSSICIESDGVYFEPNRIFFMEDVRLFNKPIGTHVRIYNIEYGSIEPYFLGDSRNLLIPSHVWNHPPLFVEQCF